MSLSSNLSGDTLTLSIKGRFDFNLHREFREAYKAGEGKDLKYVIDLAGTEYMDSSALGMLLLLREFAGGENSDITITHCNPEIRKILTISNFDRLFKIK